MSGTFPPLYLGHGDLIEQHFYLPPNVPEKSVGPKDEILVPSNFFWGAFQRGPFFLNLKVNSSLLAPP